MIPGQFKKDSRVWLHKNSKRKHPETELSREYRNDCYRHETRICPAYEDEGWDRTPNITGADGKPYKKDSRTWLHKCSTKTKMKGIGDDGGHGVKPAKNPRRMWDVMKRMKELASQERKAPIMRAQDSSEMIRGVINMAKRKKNSSRLGRGCGASISHRDIHIVEENEERMFTPASNDKRLKFRFVKESYSDQDNICDDSSTSESDQDDEDDDDRDERKMQSVDAKSANVSSRYAILNCNGCESLSLCRSNASIELSQEGLNAVWEISNQIHQQANKRSAYLLENENRSIIQEDHIPMDLSNGGMHSSRSSLNLCGTNLSDECVTALEEVPGEESDYQLSEATQGLNVKSPPTNLSRVPVEVEEEVKVVVD